MKKKRDAPPWSSCPPRGRSGVGTPGSPAEKWVPLLPPALLTDSPLISSSTPAMSSSRTTFAGQRPRPGGRGADLSPSACEVMNPWVPGRMVEGRLVHTAVFTGSSGSTAIRHPSMLSAPVPHASTLAATVPTMGLRATTTGSKAGLSAVPRPSGTDGLPHRPHTGQPRPACDPRSTGTAPDSPACCPVGRG